MRSLSMWVTASWHGMVKPPVCPCGASVVEAYTSPWIRLLNGSLDVRCMLAESVQFWSWLLRIRSIFDRFDKDSVRECLVEFKGVVSAC